MEYLRTFLDEVGSIAIQSLSQHVRASFRKVQRLLNLLKRWIRSIPLDVQVLKGCIGSMLQDSSDAVAQI